jgi:hypothetical protein
MSSKARSQQEKESIDLYIEDTKKNDKMAKRDNDMGKIKMFFVSVLSSDNPTSDGYTYLKLLLQLFLLFGLFIFEIVGIVTSILWVFHAI